MPGTVVVKCGGNAAVDPLAVCQGIAKLVAEGHRCVLVHGASADIERLAARLRVPSRGLTTPEGVTSRFTDDAMLEVVTLALTGIAKPRLVAALVNAGVPAVGLSGLDGGLVRARRARPRRTVVDGRTVLTRGGHAGRVVGVERRLLRALLDSGYLPVVSPPALAEDGRPVNTDADRVAAAVAVAMSAHTLVFLTGAPGVLADPTDHRSVRATYSVPPEGVPADVAGGIALKLIAAREALDGGVSTVRIADGRAGKDIAAALSSGGTRVVTASPSRPTQQWR